MASDLKLKLEILATGGQATAAQIRQVQEAAKAAAQSQIGGNEQARTSVGATAAQVAELAFRYNNVVGALQNLFATAKPVYDFLIGSNAQLNQQILSSQTNLASTSRIKIDGQEITDTTAKIKATEGAVRAALKQVERDTQELVGVTSAQVNELFQITLTNATAISGQSKQFPDAIAAATTLTKGWAASLKVVGVPLFQARQEINSILKGQIDQNSILAKNLNITNQQVERWRSQGRLVDELNTRLQVFVSGNAIAARSIEGISSNIQDLVERLGREAGAPFLDPIIDGLAAVEKYLKGSESDISAFLKVLVADGLEAGGEIGTAFAPAGKALLDIGEDTGPIALSALQGIAQVGVTLAQVLGPLANLLGQVVKLLADLGASDLGGIVVQTAAIILVMGQLQVIAGALAATVLPSLWAAVLATATTMGTLYASVVAVATGNTALATSIPALVTAFNALTASALPLTAALIPLAQAIALTQIVKTTGELESANNALEEYRKQFESSADGARNLGAELKQLQGIRNSGGALDAQQLAREKQLLLGLKLQAEASTKRIEGLKALKVANEDQSKARDNAIKIEEAQIKRIQKITGGLILEGKELQSLGTLQEQYAAKVAAAQRQLNSDGGGDTNLFKQAAKDLIDLAKTGVSTKQINIATAREQLAAIQSNTKVEIETQIAAKDAINGLYDARIAKIKELIETSELASGAGLAELEQVAADPGLDANTRRKAGQQIVAIRKEQIGAELAALATGQAQIAALQAQQRLGEAEADRQLTESKRAEVAKRLEINRVAQQQATNDTERANLLAEQQKYLAEANKLEAEYAERSRQRAVTDYDERRALLKAQRDLGTLSQADYSLKVARNDQAQYALQINQQRAALALLAENDQQGREVILAKIAELQSKAIASEKSYYQEAIILNNTYYDQQLKGLEAAYQGQILSEQQFFKARAQNRLSQASDEIAAQRQQLARLGAADIEGRSAINARIAELQVQRIAALDQLQQSELELIRRYQSKATSLLSLAEAERNALIQDSANRQLTTMENIELAKLAAQKESLSAQLALAQTQEQQLAALANRSRSPEAERAYQEQVRAARLSTAQLTLRLLEQEGQQLATVRQQAIRGIEDQQAAADRSNTRQLSALKDRQAAQAEATRQAEAGSARQVASIDRVSKSLGLQNDLFKAQNDLRSAIDGLENAQGDRQLQRANEAIALREKLDKGEFSSAQERIDAQRRLAQLSGSNTQSLGQLQEAKAKIEADGEARKLAQLARQQEIARQQLAIQQQQADLAVRRATLEARISKIKADQALLDAQALISQERLTTAKAVGAARSDLAKAQQQAPGAGRDRAIADAQARINEAEADGRRREQSAVAGVDAARQGVELAQQSVELAQQAQTQQAEINRLQQATLSFQQQAGIIQAQATKDTERQAAAYNRLLEAAKSYQVIPAPQISVPAVPNAQPAEGSNQAIIRELQSLRQIIEKRPPVTPLQATFTGKPDSAEFDEFLKAQRAMLRGQV